MAKSIKLKENYIDSSGIVHKRKTLQEILNNILYFVGEVNLWRGNLLINNSGSFQPLGIFYHLKETLINTFPLNSSCTRKYKLQIEYSDNKTSGNVYIRINSTDSAILHEYLFPNTWGDTGDGVKQIQVLEAQNIEDFAGHIQVSITPDFATGGTIRIYSISILIYDELK